MWPRRCVDFYVHEEFEMPYKFASDQKLGDAYVLVPRSAALSDFVKYVSKLARFPVIMRRVSNTSGMRWFVIPINNQRDLEDIVGQIQ